MSERTLLFTRFAKSQASVSMFLYSTFFFAIFFLGVSFVSIDFGSGSVSVNVTSDVATFIGVIDILILIGSNWERVPIGRNVIHFGVANSHVCDEENVMI